MTRGDTLLAQAWARAQDPHEPIPVPSAPVPRAPRWLSSEDVLSTVVGAALGGRGSTRQNPSAGGLYPVEVQALGPDSVTLSLAWWRTAAKYSTRAWMSCLLDLGFAIAAVETSSHLHGVGIRSIETDPDLARAVRITWDRPCENLWDGPPATSPPAAPPDSAPWTGDVLREALGFSVEPLPPQPGLSLGDLRERRSGQWESAGEALPVSAMSTLCHQLPAGCVAQLIDPDVLCLTRGDAEEPLQPLSRGDARATLAQWCGGQPMVATCSGAVIVTQPTPPGDASPSALDYGRSLLNAGRYGYCVQVSAAMMGWASRPIAGWVNADIGRAMGRESALITHAVVCGPRSADAHDKKVRKSLD